MVVDDVPSGDDDDNTHWSVHQPGWEVSQQNITDHYKKSSQDIASPDWLTDWLLLTEVKAVIVSTSAEMLRHHHWQVEETETLRHTTAPSTSQIPYNTGGEETKHWYMSYDEPVLP